MDNIQYVQLHAHQFDPCDMLTWCTDCSHDYSKQLDDSLNSLFHVTFSALMQWGCLLLLTVVLFSVFPQVIMCMQCQT